METTMKIVCREFIPQEIMQGLVGDLKNDAIVPGIEVERKQDRYLNATGQDLIAITFFLHNAIGQSLLANAISAIVHPVIISVYKRFKTYFQKHKENSKDPLVKKKSIQLRFEDERSSIDFELNGDISDPQLQIALETFSDTVNQLTLTEKFNDPRFVIEENKKIRLRIRFNEETNKWEIVDMDAAKKKFEAYRRNTGNNFN